MKTTNQYNPLVKEWIIEFTKRIKISSGSKKIKFSYLDAVNASDFNRTELDNLLIEYVNFIKENPLKKNDFYKYVNSYRDGRELNLKYFRHSVEKLKDYYKKVDANKKYNPFSEVKYYDYVLFMMLKLKGFYKREYDDVFNVTIKDHREYSPLSMIPSVFRGGLPFKVKEYDIARAYPTFIDIELRIHEREVDVYSLIDKTEFNTLINMHHEVKGESIEGLRAKLKPIYGARVNEVITGAFLQ